MIQGRHLCRAGSEAAVDKGAVVRGRRSRADVGGGPARCPGCPVKQQLALGQRLPRPSSPLRRPPWTVHKRTQDYSALPTRGYCGLGQLERPCWVVARSQLQRLSLTVWPSANCSVSGPVCSLGLGIIAAASQGGCGGRGCGRALWNVTQRDGCSLLLSRLPRCSFPRRARQQTLYFL